MINNSKIPCTYGIANVIKTHRPQALKYSFYNYQNSLLVTLSGLWAYIVLPMIRWIYGGAQTMYISNMSQTLLEIKSCFI